MEKQEFVSIVEPVTIQHQQASPLETANSLAASVGFCVICALREVRLGPQQVGKSGWTGRVSSNDQSGV